MKFALWFKSLLPEGTEANQATLGAWAKVYEQLVAYDKRPPEQIAAVCKWARQDSFWTTNFLSPLKLRRRNDDGVKYFDVFLAKMEQAKHGNPSGSNSTPSRTTGTLNTDRADLYKDVGKV